MHPPPSSLGLRQVPDKCLLRMELSFPFLLHIQCHHLLDLVSLCRMSRVIVMSSVNSYKFFSNEIRIQNVKDHHSCFPILNVTILLIKLDRNRIEVALGIELTNPQIFNLCLYRYTSYIENCLGCFMVIRCSISWFVYQWLTCLQVHVKVTMSFFLFLLWFI